MEPKTIEWRPGPAVCRCCLAEGCYKDISTEYFWMGKREVYAEMLSETLDLTIAYSTSGGPNSNSRLICEQCISKLRDATEFKRQVQECERTFMQWLDPGSSIVEAAANEVKLEQVKKEKNHNSDVDEDFDDQPDFGDDDEYEDLEDDIPLTKYASKTPKREPEDIQDLLDNTKPPKRKSTTAKDKSTTKKAKVTKEKATSSKPKPEKKKKGPEDKNRSEKERIQKKGLFERSVDQNPQRRNAVLLLKHSTAIPFKTRYNRIMCSYCHDEFELMDALRNHVKTLHGNADYNSAFYKVFDHLKIDVSYFKCRICSLDIESVDHFMYHLFRDHDKDVNFNVTCGVLPYKQNEEGAWMCLDCDKVLPDFNHINGHLRSHAKIFTCSKCSATFLSESGLKQHERNFKCFKSTYKPRYGMSLQHRFNAEIILQCSTACPFRTWGQNFNCVFCRVQSNHPNGLRSHMASHHANFEIQGVFNKKQRKEFLKVDITDLRCKLCFISIESLDELMTHLKNDHKRPIIIDAQPGVLPFKLNDGSSWKCAICSMEFTEFVSLKKHTVEHYQNYVCDTCGEGFITEVALTAHTKIPHDNKYNCSRCVATFSTLEERNIHLKSQHTSLRYMCRCCKDKPRFATWELRKRHLMEIHNYKPGAEMYECMTCHMTFKSRSGKYHHNVKAHRSKNELEYGFSCGQCSRTFATKISLDKHVAKKHCNG